MADKKKKESKKAEQYENPYFGKKKPTSPDLMTWDVTNNYTGKDRKYIKKERFTEEEKAERKKKQKAYMEKHGERGPRRKKLYPVTKDGTKAKNTKFYGYTNMKKY